MARKDLIRYVSAATLVFGVSGSALASPHHRSIRGGTPQPQAACTFPDGTTPTKRSEIHCYTPAQFMQAYGIDKIHKPVKDGGLGLTGKGQTIILVDSFGSPTAQADLDHFSETFGLPKTNIEFIYPNGPYTNPLSNEDEAGWAQETTLDLEWAHAVAPDATIVNIVTNVSETVGLAGLPELFDGIKTAVQKYPGAIVSMSFGTGEPTFTASDIKDYLQGSFHQILKDGTTADMTFLASSGDSGSTNMNATQDALISSPNASYPASDPLITAVGGTALEAGWRWTPEGTADDYWNCVLSKKSPCPTDFLKSVKTDGPLKETVWKEDWAIAAGGGGVSTIFKAESFQSKVGSDALKAMNGFRGVPDISLNAAINGGVDVYTSFISAAAGISAPTWQSFGGTSCAAPETAGLVALAGQRASEALGKKVGIGYLNPTIYALDDKDYHDVQSQSFSDKVAIDNDGLYFNKTVLDSVGPEKMPPVAVVGFPTLAKYDLATGRGSPRAESFVVDVANARVAREKAKASAAQPKKLP